jgi:hypothetical protein
MSFHLISLAIVLVILNLAMIFGGLSFVFVGFLRSGLDESKARGGGEPWFKCQLKAQMICFEIDRHTQVVYQNCNFVCCICSLCAIFVSVT